MPYPKNWSLGFFPTVSFMTDAKILLSVMLPHSHTPFNGAGRRPAPHPFLAILPSPKAIYIHTYLSALYRMRICYVLWEYVNMKGSRSTCTRCVGGPGRPPPLPPAPLPIIPITTFSSEFESRRSKEVLESDPPDLVRISNSESGDRLTGKTEQIETIVIFTPFVLLVLVVIW